MMISSGNPKLAKNFQNAPMVVAAVAVFSGNASVHFECISMITNTW